MADDPTGGLAHAMPRQPRSGWVIEARWARYWEPQCVLASKKADDPAAEFAVLHSRYGGRITRLLAAGIAWTTILRGDLDSPLRDGTEFDRLLCLAIERRRCRMNRVKGKGKKYAHRRRSGSQ